MPAFKHRAYGLNFLSDMELIGMKRAEFDHADVVVRLGPVDADVERHRRGKITRFRAWEASNGHFLLEMENIARYLVIGGDSIIVEKKANARDQDIMAFFTGSALAALLQQRRLFTLHASAIKTSQGAALFLGRSGAGKSTLCYAMQKSGYPMVSDDVSAIDFDGDDAPYILPSFPTTRLWGNALEKFGRPRENNIQLRTELDKYLVPADAFCAEPQPISRIFYLTKHNHADISLQKMADADRFQILSRFTFRRKFYPAQGIGQFYFASVLKLVKSVAMVKISRPESPFLLDELVSRVTENLIASPEKMNLEVADFTAHEP